MTPFISVSFSGGKDSTAMLLQMIEKGEQINEVVFCDTGLEFPQMYDHVKKIREIVESHNINFVTLTAPYSFDYYLLEYPIDSKKYGLHYGFGWPTPVIRWCTKHLKTQLIEQHYKELSDIEVIRCIGLASDEQKRIERTEGKTGYRYPLNEWGQTEKDALQYCYSKGFDWGGLYEIFGRVSCWCCPLQPIGALKKLYKLYPDLWAQLQKWDENITMRGFKAKYRDTYTV